MNKLMIDAIFAIADLGTRLAVNQEETARFAELRTKAREEVVKQANDVFPPKKTRKKSKPLEVETKEEETKEG